MKIGIVGNGVVGSACARSYLEHVDEVRVYDVMKERRTHELNSVLECDLIFICLPTPLKEDGGLDLSPIECYCRYVKGGRYNLVLRSTVPIGTTRRLRKQFELPNLVHSPEFLTARCSFVDAQIPARNVIGYPEWEHRESETGSVLFRLYQDRFPGVRVFELSSDESEAVKLFQNSFFAVKVAFFNEVRLLADELDLNWNRVMEAVLADGRITHSHTRVPGPDGKYGFGGSCLPKDLKCLVDQLVCRELNPAVTLAAYSRNFDDRKRGE